MRRLFFGIALALSMFAGSSYGIAIAEEAEPTVPLVEETVPTEPTIPLNEPPAADPHCGSIASAIDTITKAAAFEEIVAAMVSTGVFKPDGMPTFDVFENDLEYARTSAISALEYARAVLSCE